MAGETKATQNHDEIRKWAEMRSGKPARVRGTGTNNDSGLLRIDFPGFGKEGSLEDISWDEFFNKFDAKDLTFLYQDQTSDGKESRFFKLVSRAPVGSMKH